MSEVICGENEAGREKMRQLIHSEHPEDVLQSWQVRHMMRAKEIQVAMRKMKAPVERHLNVLRKSFSLPCR